MPERHSSFITSFCIHFLKSKSQSTHQPNHALIATILARKFLKSTSGSNNHNIFSWIQTWTWSS